MRAAMEAVVGRSQDLRLPSMWCLVATFIADASLWGVGLWLGQKVCESEDVWRANCL